MAEREQGSPQGEGGTHTAETGLRRYEVYGATEASSRHPNQDAFTVNGENGFMGVFDGMTKAKGSEKAAAAAKLSTEEILGKKNYSRGTVQEARAATDSISAAAREKITAEAKGKYKKMGTTAAIVQIVESGETRKAVIGYAGDSRVYRVKKNGCIERLTTDQGFVRETTVQETTEAESLDWANRILDKMDEVKSKSDFLKILGEGVSVEDVLPYLNTLSNSLSADKQCYLEVLEVDILEDDALFIATTDGIHDVLRKSEMEKILKQLAGKGELTPQKVTQTLLTKSIEYNRDNPGAWRAKDDDKTITAMRVN